MSEFFRGVEIIYALEGIGSKYIVQSRDDCKTEDDKDAFDDAVSSGECITNGTIVANSLWRDTDYNDDPMCPHCGYLDQHWGESAPNGAWDGSEWYDECPNCGGGYTIEMQCSPTFSTEISEGKNNDNS